MVEAHSLAHGNASRYGAVAARLDSLQAQGRLVASVAELAQHCGLSYLAARRQLERLALRVVRLPGRPSIVLLVPPEHRARGAPPIAAWLDAYMRYRAQPYYVGLLSAAALHGAAQQAPQVTQIITESPLRPIEVGRLRVDSYVKHHLRRTPLSELAGLPAPLAVSTPEATALDLIAFNTRIGGIRRVAELISQMRPAFTVRGLRKALEAEEQAALKQRLGYVLEVLGMERMAAEVGRHLPARCMAVPLQTHASKGLARSTAVQPWRIVDNVSLKEPRLPLDSGAPDAGLRPGRS